MKPDPIYHCPVSRGSLTFEQNGEAGSYQSLVQELEYPVRDGICDFTYPRELTDSDQRSLGEYEKIYSEYDKSFDFVFQSFGVDKPSFRTKLTGLLGIKPGMTVLEVGCGTGEDSVYLARAIGSTGKLYVQDLSRGMLSVCRSKLQKSDCPSEFSLSNASYLPFADNTFDAVFHFGGINTFAERGRAVAELSRVCKVGGRVLFGDESVPPWLREEEYGKILMTINPLYRHQPPIEDIPPEARNVQINWLLNEVFYAITFDVMAGPPTINLDYPIPGMRGGTARSRVYGQIEGVQPSTKKLIERACDKAKIGRSEWIDKVLLEASLNALK